MISKVIQLEIKCQELDREIYPRISSALDDIILFCLELTGEQQVAELSNIIFRLRNEFESLIFFERKLVFTALLESLKRQEENSAFTAVNISELMRLISIKQERITTMIEILDVPQWIKYPEVYALLCDFKCRFIPLRAELYKSVIPFDTFSDLKFPNYGK